MGRANASKLLTKRVKLAVACDALACCKRTFSRRWHGVFTDPRPVEDRRRSVERPVLEDELAVAVESGRAAVLNYRRQVGRV